jgi:PAS domain S-box-containing protein
VSPEEVEDLLRVRDRLEQEVRGLREELRRTAAKRERVENIIRSVAEGLVVLDGEGKIQTLNPAAEKLLGLTQGQAIGVPIAESLKTEHVAALTKGPLLDNGAEVGKEIEVKSIDDETRKILQASSAVLQNEQGGTVGVLAVLSEITKQKKLDEMKSQLVTHRREIP